MDNNIKHIFFIGIGGVSMSGLAELMLSRKIKVSGSDWNESENVKKLRKNGATVYIGENADNITNDIDLVVYTSAVRAEHPEMKKAKDLKLNIATRADFLGEIMKEFGHSICVSGTHGKTTTTGMLSQVLVDTDLDPTIFLGGNLKVIDGNIRIGGKDLLLTEACEYKRNFLKFNPTVEIILNVEEDHLDYYKDIEDIRTAFRAYAELLDENGLLVVNYKDKDLFNNLRCNVKTFGLNEECDIYAKNISYNPKPKYTLVIDKKEITEIDLNIFGEHNILNSLSVIAVLISIGVDIDIIKNGIKNFFGTERRYELKGNVNGITVVDDYAHHPTEVRTSINSAKYNTDGNVITIFQPHTFTRLKALIDDFADELSKAEYIIIVDIYAAREPYTDNIHSKDLVEKIKKYNKNVVYAANFDEAATIALKFAKSGDIIMTMGAGDVYKIADILLK